MIAAQVPAKPALLPLIAENVPAVLKTKDQWLVTRLSLNEKGDRWTKPPFSVKTHKRADKTDTALWASFEAVCEAIEWNGYDAIGFSVKKHNGLVFLDFDHCRNPETGAIAAWATRYLRLFPESYMEPSISGTGIRVVVFGTIPEGAGRSKTITEPDAEPGAKIEWNDDSAYYTISGHVLDDGHTTPGDGQPGIDAIAAELWPPRGAMQRAAHLHVVLTDDAARERLDLARGESGFGATFCRLYDQGNLAGYGSHSEARFALLSKLAFYLGPDRNRVLEAYQASALWDKKCDSRRGKGTLGEFEVDKILGKTTDFYTPPPASVSLPIVAKSQNDQLGRFAETGLPETVADCHALILTLAAQVNALRDENAELRVRVDTALARCTELIADRQKKDRIVRNADLGSERFTFAALVDHFDRRADEADADGFIPAPRETIAHHTGFSATSVGKHIDRGEELGLIRKRVKRVVTEAGELKNVTYIAPAENVVDFADAASKIASEKKANHGGNRIGCRRHPHADVIVTTTTTKRCAECGEIVEQPTTTRRRIKNDQVGDFADEPLAETGTEGAPIEKRADYSPCGLPVIGTHSTVLHNDGPLPPIDTSGSVVADAWIRGGSLPGGPGNDRYTQ